MDDVYQLALAAHKKGRLDEAVRLYHKVLKGHPQAAHAHYLLGCLYMDQAQSDLAKEQIHEAIRLCPDNATYREVLGVLFERLGRDDLAEAPLRIAVTKTGARQEAFLHLGNLLVRKHQGAEALDLFKSAIKKFGPSMANICGIVDACAESGRKEEAYKMLDLAMHKGLLDKEALHQLRNKVARMTADHEHALEHSKKWLDENPDCIDAMNAYAAALQFADNLDESIRYSLKVLEREPGNYDSLARMGYVLSRQLRHAESVRYYQLALQANPIQHKLYSGLSYSLFKCASKADQEYLRLARYYAQKILAHEPDGLRQNTGLASIMFALLRVREGSTYFARAVKADSVKHGTSSSRLFHDNYTWFLTPQEQFDRHLSWCAFTRKIVGPARKSFPNTADPEKRLRIGFSSADFSLHPVSYFFYPVFMALNKHFDVFLYSQRAEEDEDEMTGHYRTAAKKFISVARMDDAEMADTIIADGVDVLFDLSGHTSGNRLHMFARRAAPVQVSWLGYPNTTGLDSMDYRLSDAVTEPEGEADHFSSERIVRLEGGFHLYLPGYDIPGEVSELPALRNGRITFGSFNNLKKVSPKAISMWSRLIKAVPASRIIIKDRSLDSRVNRERILSLFASYGVSSSRIILNGMMKNNFDHLRLYSQVDIALDSVPYNGTTTTCEAIIMGCPVLTTLGDRHASRVSASLLTHIGHPEWIAADEDEFVRIGVQLASDTFRLSSIRASLRKDLMSSPVCDAKHMENKMVQAIRMMWRNWCDQSGNIVPPACERPEPVISLK